MEKINVVKIAGVCGILSLIVLFFSIQIAIFNSDWFKWTHHALSDLGVDGLSAFIFNNGLIVTGIFALIFSIGLSKILKNKSGAYLLGAGSISLIFVGLFPKTIFALHYISSATFFLLIVIALFIIGFTMLRSHIDNKMGVIAIFLGILACTSPIFLKVFSGIAIPEAIVVFPALFWCMLYGIKITFNEHMRKTL